MPTPLPGSFARIRALAFNTWRETMRDRIVVGVLIFLGVMLAVVLGLEGTSPERAPAVLDASLALMGAVGALVAIFLGTSLVHKELDRKTVYIVLVKPASRQEFLLGKFLGLWATLGAMITVMAGFLTVLMLALHAMNVAIYAMCLVFWVQVGFLTALAFFFSTITSAMLSALYAFCLYIIGHQGGLIRVFAESEWGLNRFNYYGGWAFYYVLPHFEIMNQSSAVLYGNGMPWNAWGASVAYGLLMIAGTLAAASVAWETKELL